MDEAAPRRGLYLKENIMDIDLSKLLYITPRQIESYYYPWQIEMLDNDIVKVIGMFDPNDIRYFKLLKAWGKPDSGIPELTRRNYF